MREFTKEEKEFIKRIVSVHRENGVNSLRDLQVAKLLREDLKFFALKWETAPTPQITIYSPQNKQLSEKSTDELYFQIADYIYFIEELVKLGFIKLQNIPSDNKDTYTILYDRDKYKYLSDKNIFMQEMPNIKSGTNEYKVSGVISLESLQTFYTDFAYDLETCGMAIIYPLPLACSYVDNGFRTEEQMNSEAQLDYANKSLCWARCTFFITLFGLILTLIIAK